MSKRHHNCPIALRGRQSGAVLVVAMIMLLVLTLLGVTAMNTTSMQERMAANTQEYTRAFQAAETGLWTGSLDLNRSTTAAVTGYSRALDAGHNKDAGAFYTVVFLSKLETQPRSAKAWDADSAAAYYFETQSDGYSRVYDANNDGITDNTTPPSSAAEVQLRGGYYFVAHK